MSFDEDMFNFLNQESFTEKKKYIGIVIILVFKMPIVSTLIFVEEDIDVDKIPPDLIDAVKQQRAVLFLGAGASSNAKHPDNKKIPQGDDLRDLICDKFLGGDLKDKSLNTVSDMAVSETNLQEFQTYIRNLFDPFNPADFHELIPKFWWRAIITTNFDLIVERAYEQAQGPVQNLVKTVKDGDQLDTRLRKESNPVCFYKLHGCIDFCFDEEIPLILGTELYSTSYEKNRIRFYNRFRDLGYEYPIIFMGYSISDPHIGKILFDLTDPSISRPQYYLISPEISEIERRYWSRQRVLSVKSTFEHFLTEIDQAIPETARILPLKISKGQLSIRRYYVTAKAIEPPILVSYLASEVTHVYSELTASRQDPRDFYRGYDDGWSCILQNLDVYRTFTDSVLVDAILLSDKNRHVAELFMLKGPGGNGKSVSLKRIAWEAGVTYEKLVLYTDNPAGLQIEPLAEIYRLTNERIFLFVDHVALVRNELYELLQASRDLSVPLSIIGAERDNEWNIYCEHLEKFLCQEFPVRYLSEAEIEKLLTLLEENNALGLLKNLSPEERVLKFVEGAERQLLVALHEATLGIPFVNIVVDEFQRIEPAVARSLYLDICALHQFNAPVRAGLISRSSGVGFDQFQKEFIQPLENVIRVVHEGHNRDIYYRSRHQHVAELVFNNILKNPEDKFDLLAKMLKAINIDYSSDRETFSRLIKGRDITNLFPNVQLGRLFYDRVQEAVPDDPFIFHQYAVFEINHSGGSLVLAQEAADHAFRLNSGSRSIQHTQAEIARRMANDTDDPIRKQSLRRVTREKLEKNYNQASEYDLYTHALLAIDELKELSATLNDLGNDSHSSVFLEAAKETETAIQHGLKVFPGSAQLLAAEATFRELLDQTKRAKEVLEHAFNLNPRQDWLAVRLARMYQASGDLTNSKRVLNTCLKDNPASKIVHFEMGKILANTGKGEAAIEHLQRSFNTGDNNYDAQFWYARELFLQGQTDEAIQLFDALNDNAPGRFRTQSSAISEQDREPILYDSRIKRKEEGYAFLNLYMFSKDIFASRSDSLPAEWDKLYNGARTKCNLSFNRRGPRATSIVLSS